LTIDETSTEGAKVDTRIMGRVDQNIIDNAIVCVEEQSYSIRQRDQAVDNKSNLINISCQEPSNEIHCETAMRCEGNPDLHIVTYNSTTKNNAGKRAKFSKKNHKKQFKSHLPWSRLGNQPGQSVAPEQNVDNLDWKLESNITSRRGEVSNAVIVNNVVYNVVRHHNKIVALQDRARITLQNARPYRHRKIP